MIAELIKNIQTAIAKYEYEDLPRIDRMFDTVESNEDIDLAVAAQEAAQRPIKLAFYEATKDYNRLSDCMRLDYLDVKRIFGKR